MPSRPCEIFFTIKCRARSASRTDLKQGSQGTTKNDPKTSQTRHQNARAELSLRLILKTLAVLRSTRTPSQRPRPNERDAQNRDAKADATLPSEMVRNLRQPHGDVLVAHQDPRGNRQP